MHILRGSSIFCVGIFALSLATSASATLVSRLGGLAYYDTDLNITWAADANINGYDTWANQLTWVSGLNIGGVGGWRLPTTIQPDATCSAQTVSASGPVSFGFGCSGSEMGHLFNVEGITAASPGVFSNIQNTVYWTSTENANDTNFAWFYNFNLGNQASTIKTNNLPAWAVHDGDVGEAILPTDSLAFGFATAAIKKDTNFNQATDSYDSSYDDLGKTDTFSVVSGGSGAAHVYAEITSSAIENGQLKDPGLKVGSFSSSTGLDSDAASRAFAFHSFEHIGTNPLSFNINSELHGTFTEANILKANNSASAKGGIYVFDAVDFTSTINSLGGNLEDIFFPLAGKSTDQVNPVLLDDLTASQLLGLNPLAELSFSEFFSLNDVNRNLTLPSSVLGGQEFTVLYDLSTDSQNGGGGANFLNTLSSAGNFFTDMNGNSITSIVPLTLPDASVPEPTIILLLLGGGLIMGLFIRQQRIQ